MALAQCRIHEDTVYVGVGAERRVELINTSLIPTNFTWSTQVQYTYVYTYVHTCTYIHVEWNRHSMHETVVIYTFVSYESCLFTKASLQLQLIGSSAAHCCVSISPMSRSIGPRESLPITLTVTWDTAVHTCTSFSA